VAAARGGIGGVGMRQQAVMAAIWLRRIGVCGFGSLFMTAAY